MSVIQLVGDVISCLLSSLVNKNGDRQETVLTEGTWVSCFRSSGGIEKLVKLWLDVYSDFGVFLSASHCNHPQLPPRMFDLVVHEEQQDITDHCHASQVQHLNLIFTHTPPT